MSSDDGHLLELRMQVRYHRDRHRLYAARVDGSRPTSRGRLEELRRVRELAEGSLRRAEADRMQASIRAPKATKGRAKRTQGAGSEGRVERVDLQRDADDERPWTIRSNEDSERLERFRQGELDRRGNAVDRSTNPVHFYIERVNQPGGRISWPD